MSTIDRNEKTDLQSGAVEKAAWQPLGYEKIAARDAAANPAPSAVFDGGLYS